MATFFCYQDNEVRLQRTPTKYSDLDATKHWINHFGNSLYLTFLVQNEPGHLERRRAAHELSIADRKMAYWMRHPNWDRQKAEQEAERLRKQWARKRYQSP